jgi:hypothetical protein
MARVPVNDKIVQTAQKLLARTYTFDRPKLRRIVSGELKSVDVDWWRQQNGVAHWQLVRRLERGAEPKLRKIRAMADPAMNPNKHQREVAEATLAKMQAKLQAEIRAIHLPLAPGLEDYGHPQAHSQATTAHSQATTSRANTKMREMFENDVADAMRDIAAKSEPVNTKAKAAPVNTS